MRMETPQASLYIYGIVPAAATLPPGLSGVDGQPVELVVSGDHAALVSPVADADSLATPENLLAHSTVLDRVAADGPVLPLVFGTIAPGADAVAGDLLPSGAQGYAQQLASVQDVVQFTLQARYARETVIAELVAEEPEIAALREATAGRSEDESRNERIRLGELVVRGLERKSGQDAQHIAEALRGRARDVVIRRSGEAETVLELAALVERGSEDSFEQAASDLAERHAGRITFRLLGPQAPYDFVGEV